MRGNNTMEVNEASMIEAMQLLLDRDAPGIGKVTSVKANAGFKDCPTFVVSLSSEETKP